MRRFRQTSGTRGVELPATSSRVSSQTRRLLDTLADHLPAAGGRAESGPDASLSGLTGREIEVLNKVDARHRVQAVVFAYESGPVKPPAGPKV